MSPVWNDPFFGMSLTQGFDAFLRVRVTAWTRWYMDENTVLIVPQEAEEVEYQDELHPTNSLFPN